ncbi:Proteasome subunit beta type-4 [Gracilariopsis chorda]|uniref:Proteasome subunit beta n=1 Tax=Gracilariopsis chorda TaxID=448386 RepID=A0A2V3IVC9_9FLOR|nr:Proteasome subunit beta type-4 [Gracilariopsis chorda]|eukprot:PXF46045.1 Proteasome subunit beta type-4 [Gracilariopsis chorda]
MEKVIYVNETDAQRKPLLPSASSSVMSGLRLTAGVPLKDRDDSVLASAAGAPVKHTSRPIVTGSSVIAMRCKDGVVMATDTLASYGSLARFRQISRLYKATDHCVIGGGGDMSDFFELCETVRKETTLEYCYDDGHMITASAIHQMLARIMYNRRNKMDPYWNYMLVAGWQHGKPVLGYVDLVGSHFVSEVIATGYGEYLGLPLLRKAYREDITVEEGKKVLQQILTVLFYRDARTIDRIQIACVTEKGVEISEPTKLETEWSYKAFISGARASDVSTW